MFKFIFLDIDGVLNSSRSCYALRSSKVLDPIAIHLLNELVDISKADIIISSTWRLGRTIDDLQLILSEQGFKFKEKIKGKTPHVGDFRGNEIDLFLRDYRYEDFKYVILDDDRDFRKDQNLVKINSKVGLTHYDINRALYYLDCVKEDTFSLQEMLNAFN